jgi:drug/metabolite transporter (DMT)-like permease
METSQLLPHTTQSLRHSNLGVIYTLLSSIILSLATTIIKTYSSINVLAVWVWIFPVTIAISALITSHSVLIRKKNMWRKLLPFNENKTVWAMTFAQGSLTCAISYSLSLALQKISVADAKTLASTYVIFVIILSWWFLGEECSVVPIFACILTLLGIGVMMRPSFLTGEENFDLDTLVSSIIHFIKVFSYLFIDRIFICYVLRRCKDHWTHEFALSSRSS